MSLNDKSMMSESAKGAVYPGIANPTSANDISGSGVHSKPNFAEHPSSQGASQHHEHEGPPHHPHKHRGGVIEARPGIIETTNIEPLHKLTPFHPHHRPQHHKKRSGNQVPKSSKSPSSNAAGAESMYGH
ncbi:hypothetical protein FA15DRAFT_699466 [Coprinopsis marcescibilis]|uniref:Uncharacterized protein n=1 Tax=Coprinopsis marcescibilis TaxID=230819 RepID=A0A5C3LAJ9_COPMA|nr:hypothetical protein FA15DRAFT_699466 [Coprinopsis marcescibilis]